MAKYLRLAYRNHLQTPVHHFTRRVTGRQVTLVGVSPIGEPGYYERLATLITEREAVGAVVHCEGSSLRPCDDPEITSEEEQLLTEYRRLNALLSGRVGEFGWQVQFAGFGDRPRWKIIDLSELEILRRAGADEFRRLIAVASELIDLPGGDRAAVQRFRSAVLNALRVTATALRPAPVDPTNEEVLAARNTVALGGVAGTDDDTVLVWGALHLPGLRAGLEAQGFIEVGKPVWHTAVEIDAAGGRRRAVWN